MSITEGLVLNLYLVLEITCQLFVGLLRECRQAILGAQLQLHNITEFLEVWRRQPEHILETVLHSRVILEEVLETFG